MARELPLRTFLKFGLFLFVFVPAVADSPPLQIQTQDATVKGVVTKLKVDNGTLSKSGTVFTLSSTSATLPSGSTQYIQNRNTLQSGATFYLSSGTVTNINTTTLKFNDGTTQTSAAGAANFIMNQNTLQSGSTFYVSSGTVSGQLSANNIVIPVTDQGPPQVGVIYMGANRYIHSGGTSANVFVGINSGNLTATGDSDVGVGFGALKLLTSGNNNVAVGADALRSNSTGGTNFGLGTQACWSCNSNYNVAIGYNALFNTTGGGINIGIGSSSGITNTTGSNNLFIGDSADATTSGLNYAGAIGSTAKVSASNSIILGGMTPSISVGIGVTAPNGQLHVKSGDSTRTILIIQNASSQSGNSQEWQDSLGVVLSSVAANGNITASTVTATTAIVFSDATRQTTAASPSLGAFSGALFVGLTSGSTFQAFVPTRAITLKNISFTIDVASAGGSGDTIVCSDTSSNSISVTSANAAAAGTLSTSATGTVNISAGTTVYMRMDSAAITKPQGNATCTYVMQ